MVTHRLSPPSPLLPLPCFKITDAFTSSLTGQIYSLLIAFVCYIIQITDAFTSSLTGQISDKVVGLLKVENELSCIILLVPLTRTSLSVLSIRY